MTTNINPFSRVAPADGSANIHTISMAGGAEGVRFYTRLKTVTSRSPGASNQGAEFVMPTSR